MTDDFAALAQHETLDGFEAVLQTSGGLDGEARSHDKEEGQQESEDEQLHRERIRDRRLRVFGLEVERPQKCCDATGEQIVQDLGKPELFRHEAGY
jgi:hypothetical protein